MKTLIVYGTKYGSTKTVCERLAAHFEDATLADAGSGGAFDITDYDCVVVGSPLTAGSIRKAVRAFMARYADELAAKRLGLFLCGLQAADASGCFEANFPSRLLETARARAFLGGVFDPEKCGFMARKVIKAAAKLEGYTSTVDEAQIARFAAELLA